MKVTTITKLLLLVVIGSLLFFAPASMVKATSILRAGTESLKGEAAKSSKDSVEESKTVQHGTLKKPHVGPEMCCW